MGYKLDGCWSVLEKDVVALEESWFFSERVIPDIIRGINSTIEICNMQKM